jgi:hypothetical protein
MIRAGFWTLSFRWISPKQTLPSSNRYLLSVERRESSRSIPASRNCVYKAFGRITVSNQHVGKPTPVGAQHDATPAQIALAWLLVQKPWIGPIPGTRKLHRLDENLGALDIELTADDLSEIREAMADITVVGDRYKQQSCARNMCHRSSVWQLMEPASGEKSTAESTGA